MAIAISINGKLESVADGTTVAGLLERMAVRRDVVTVELNRSIVDPARFEATALRPGDVVELVYLVGGDRGQPRADVVE